MLRNRNAQAVIELAILGAIIITAFGILIGYSENYNREQSYMQQTFRAALKKAQEINNSANWTTTDFRRMPNVTNPMEIGQKQQFGSGNSVLWSDGKLTEADKPKAFFELNRISVVEVPISEGAGAQAGATTVTNSWHTSRLNAFTASSTHTQKELHARDGIVGSADVGDGNVSLNSSLGDGGLYTGGGLDRP